MEKIELSEKFKGDYHFLVIYLWAPPRIMTKGQQQQRQS